MNIIIADDHPLILEGLEKAISSKLDKAHIFCCTNKNEVFETLKNFEIDILIQDIKFGDDDARTFLQNFISNFPNLKIIALTSLTDAASIQSVLKTGIHGYILKSESTREIFNGIETVSQNKIYLSQGVAESLSKFMQLEIKSEKIHLTLREKEVLREILAEKSTKEIAQILFISDKTVEHHRANLFAKMEVKNLAGLVKKTIELRLLD